MFSIGFSFTFQRLAGSARVVWGVVDGDGKADGGTWCGDGAADGEAGGWCWCAGDGERQGGNRVVGVAEIGVGGDGADELVIELGCQ